MTRSGISWVSAMLLAALVSAACASAPPVSPSPMSSPGPSVSASAATPGPTTPAQSRPLGTDSESGLAWVAVADLPPQARTTLDLIEAGGPFPFDRDGIVFRNRERLLPRQPRDYYREYTVETPGSDDRGPRRIVAGEAGERYYTADHYDSFARIHMP